MLAGLVLMSWGLWCCESCLGMFLVDLLVMLMLYLAQKMVKVRRPRPGEVKVDHTERSCGMRATTLWVSC